MAKKDKAKVSKTTLMRTVNDLLGKEALLRLHAGLSNEGYDKFTRMLGKGKISLHNDGEGHIGFTADTKKGWTSEGFTITSDEFKQAVVDTAIGKHKEPEYDIAVTLQPSIDSIKQTIQKTSRSRAKKKVAA